MKRFLRYLRHAWIAGTSIALMLIVFSNPLTKEYSIAYILLWVLAAALIGLSVWAILNRHGSARSPAPPGVEPIPGGPRHYVSVTVCNKALKKSTPSGIYSFDDRQLIQIDLRDGETIVLQEEGRYVTLRGMCKDKTERALRLEPLKIYSVYHRQISGLETANLRIMVLEY